MLKSKTNSVKYRDYKLQPIGYNKNNDLIFDLYKLKPNKRVCKLTGLYKFNEDKFEIISTAKNWLNKNHKKLLQFLLREYDIKL